MSRHKENVIWVSFGSQGKRIYAESQNEKLVWDVATRSLIPGANWEPPPEPIPVSSDGRWLITSQIDKVVLVDLETKNLPYEKAYWMAKARLDPPWHQSQAIAATKAENWYAATFYFALLIKYDPEKAAFHDGLQLSFKKLKSQFEQQELDVEPYLALVVKESLQLPRGLKLPKSDTTEASAINSATWEKVSTPDAFEKATPHGSGAQSLP